MYLKFYGLAKKPFHTTPDPNFLFLTPSHKEALGAMLYGIDHRKGFVAIIGEVGVGKTTIVRSFLEQFDWKEEQTNLIYVYNPILSMNELLKCILSELNERPKSEADAELVSQLQQILIKKYREGGTVVLIIDEAQNMPPQTLEHLRMLSNLETSTDKLIQIILVGQPELETLLQQHELRQLRQRIAVWATIRALSEQESIDYISHRLVRAGLHGKHIFQKNALKVIIKQAAGIPRRLNIFCDNALITGLGYRQNPITVAIAKEVVADIDNEAPKQSWRWIPAATGVLFLLLGAGVIPFIQEPLKNLAGNTFTISQSPAAVHITEENPDGLPPHTEVSSPSVMHSGPAESLNVANLMVPRSGESKEMQTGSSDVQVIQKKEDIRLLNLMPQNESSKSMEPSQLHPSRNNPNIQEQIETNNTKGRDSSQKNEVAFISTALLPAAVSKHEPEHTQKEASTIQGAENEEEVTTRNGSQTRTIRRGDTLAEIVLEVYGSADPELIQFVLSHNPDITHVRKILPGQNITLPHLDEFARNINQQSPQNIVHMKEKKYSKK